MDMMRPLYLQYDTGFGTIADSFKSSADALDKDTEAGGLHSHLPISFLFRHSVELYLKSCIIIFHRRFDISYPDTVSGEAAICIEGRARLLKDIHALLPLYSHLKSLIHLNKEYLSTLKDIDWNLSSDLESRLKRIDGMDASSTFFRYPVTKDKPKDKYKSIVHPKDWGSMVESMHTVARPVKAFLVVDIDNNVVEAFGHDNEKVKTITKLLRETAADFYNLHAMIVWKLVPLC